MQNPKFERPGLVGPALPTMLALYLLSAPMAGAQDECPINEADYRRVVLVNQPVEPMKLAVLPDGRVLWAERRGLVRIYLPSTSTVEEAARISVYKEADNGLLGIAVDPNFASNGWVYVSYDPLSDNHPDGAGRWLSRFTLSGNRFDMASEKRILHVKIDRTFEEGCCHHGAGLAMDAKGNIHWTTGENSDYRLLYANVNETKFYQNSLRSSGNTNDLRGKLLRVHPEADGSYTIPEGNLFPKGANGAPGLAKTRPEIYAMGLRNPFSVSVDSKTGWVFVGDISIDAVVPSEEKGSPGFDEINLLTKAGNLGHPFATGANAPMRNYDYATNQPKEWFDMDAPKNNSTFNTGLTDLAPAGKLVPALIYWTVRSQYSTVFTGFGDGRTAAMVGPTYRYNAAGASAVRMPASMDGKVFFWDHEREWIRVLTTTPSGGVGRIDKFMPSTPWRGLVDIQAGPDGALYLAEYGHSFYTANPEAKISRVEYIGKPCGSVGARMQPDRARAAPGPARARLVMADPARGIEADLPEGFAGLDVVALDGRLLWRGEGLSGHQLVPASALAGLGRGGLVTLRFR